MNDDTDNAAEEELIYGFFEQWLSNPRIFPQPENYDNYPVYKFWNINTAMKSLPLVNKKIIMDTIPTIKHFVFVYPVSFVYTFII